MSISTKANDAVIGALAERAARQISQTIIQIRLKPFMPISRSPAEAVTRSGRASYGLRSLPRSRSSHHEDHPGSPGYLFVELHRFRLVR